MDQENQVWGSLSKTRLNCIKMGKMKWSGWKTIPIKPGKDFFGWEVWVIF